MRCPLCDSEGGKQIINAKGWRIWSCLNCKNAWTEPALMVMDYSTRRDFHGDTVGADNTNHVTTLDDLPDQWRRGIVMQNDLLFRHLNPGAKILEIGCGKGLLLSQLASNGFDVRGIEPSTSACARARKKRN